MAAAGGDETSNRENRAKPTASGGLPPGWRAFIRFCQQLRYGEIERLRIQDGVPVIAETVQKKIKFPPES
jgi:hypothetical protein